MKIITSSQIRAIDRHTIETEPIPSIHLMERAASQVFRWIKQHYSCNSFCIFAGPGNNGGDALALGRMLLNEHFNVKIFIYRSHNLAPDAQINLERLNKIPGAHIFDCSVHSLPDTLPSQTIIIDGLFGSGLNRPLEGKAAEIVRFINNNSLKVVSIDIPSGLFCENNENNVRENIVEATFTLSFEMPKLAFLFPENQANTGEWIILPIGLSAAKIDQTPTPWQLITSRSIEKKMPHRNTFDHKGIMGHALLIAGSYGKMGAAHIASSACLSSGVGLLTTHIPHKALGVIQTSLPEAMTSIDRSDLMFTEFPDLSPFKAIGIGPGLGTYNNSQRALKELIDTAKGMKIVIDADGLNMLSLNPEYLDKLPPGTILTPHPKEFERLAGTWSNDYERMLKAIDFAGRYNIILVLKGAWSMIAEPGGQVFFNSTGNPGMATAGSGDALTGVILALLARGMNSLDAALTGVFVHGLAGDLAVTLKGTEGLIASDIVDHLGPAFLNLHYYTDS